MSGGSAIGSGGIGGGFTSTATAGGGMISGGATGASSAIGGGGIGGMTGGMGFQPLPGGSVPQFGANTGYGGGYSSFCKT